MARDRGFVLEQGQEKGTMIVDLRSATGALPAWRDAFESWTE
jgi:hypothetical protein